MSANVVGKQCSVAFKTQRTTIRTTNMNKSTSRVTKSMKQQRTHNMSTQKEVPLRKKMDSLASQLGVNKMEDWYKFQDRQDTSFFTSHYGQSLKDCLERSYPEFEWKIWRFDAPPSHLWNDKKTQIEAVEWLAESLGIRNIDDWYSIRIQQVKETSTGRSLLKHHSDSLHNLLRHVYSEQHWQNWRFASQASPALMYKHKYMLIELGNKLGVNEMEDWYKMKKMQFPEMKAIFSSWYAGSLINALLNFFPEFPWEIHRFAQLPKSYWLDPSNQRTFIKWAANQLGIKHYEDWYAIRHKQFVELGGERLVQLKGSFPNVIMTCLPEYSWEISKFDKSILPEHHKEFFDEVGKLLNVRVMSDWYNVTTVAFEQTTRSRFIWIHYGGSMSRALMTVYPEYDWKIWRFANVPHGFWDDDNNIREFLEWTAKELGVKSDDDWLSVSTKEIQQLGGGYLVTKKYKGLVPLLAKYIPSFQVKDESKMRWLGASTQYYLQKVARELFPTATILTNYKHPAMRFTDSRAKMEFDVYLPELSLALEYQSEYHYKATAIDSHATEVRDEMKKKAAAKIGVTLVCIPFWWDRLKDSIAATIHQYRPDLIPVAPGEPIPDFFPKAEHFQFDLCTPSHWMPNSLGF